ncbi:MAG TPA: thioesterase family protein [Puia sp.]|jgi:acyl-CoA thioester hydrolase
MFTSETQIRVRYAETDQMNVVYHGNYSQYFEVGRVESIRQLGLSYKELEATGIIMPVIEWSAKFLRPARYDDLLTIKTTLRQLPTDHRVEFIQEAYNEEGTLLVLGKVLLYFLHAGTMAKATIPKELALKLQPFFREHP